MNSEATTVPLELDNSATESVAVSKAFELSEKLSSVSIIFPAYNEEENIANSINNAIKAFSKYFNEVTVIPVDDGGHDATGEIIDNMAAKDERIKPVHHEVNKGYGAALRSGFSAAENDFIFFSDSDGQFDLEEITLLLEHIDTFDMVLGYRAHRADPLHRKLNAWAWGGLVRLLFRVKVKDIDCAFKLFRRDIFNEINLQAGGAMVNTELLALARKRGFSMTNVPVSHYPRQLGEQTGANPLVIIRAFVELFKLYAKIS